MENDEDLHNPFGGQEKKKRQRGVFDPDHKGDGSDPFKSPVPDDSKWDEPDDSSSTRDV